MRNLDLIIYSVLTYFIFYFLKTSVYYLQLSQLHRPYHWPVAGWVLGGMLGDSPSSVVAGGSTVTGQYPVVGQCDAGAVILCGARLWADPLEAGRAGSEAAAQWPESTTDFP